MTVGSSGQALNYTAVANGNALEDRGEDDRALAVYRQAVAIAPTYPRGHMNIGNVLRKLDRPDEAVEAYRVALTLASDYFPARFNLGSLLTARGDYVTAEAELREALTPCLLSASCRIHGSTSRFFRRSLNRWAGCLRTRRAGRWTGWHG